MALEAAAAFASLRSSFQQARTALPEELSGSAFVLAGETVRVRVVGRRLAGLLARPFAHLATPHAAAGTPRLTVDLWDREALAPGSVEDPGEEHSVTSSTDGRFLAQAAPHSLLALDRREGRLIGCVRSGSQLPTVEIARPPALPLTVWGADRGIFVIHAGMVAKDGEGVLLAGLAEAGKSTAALACAGAGFDFLADDCLALTERAQGSFEGHCIYASATLDHDHLARFPSALAAAVDPAPRNGKAPIFPLEVSPFQVTRLAPIRALAIPRVVASATSRARPAPKGEAMRRVAPETVAMHAVPPQACMSRLARLVEQVPCFWLELDDDLGAIPRRVERLMADAGIR